MKQKHEDWKKKLRKLERQLLEYQEEDYVREAQELEEEMMQKLADGEVNEALLELPPGFLEKVLAKGKLLESQQEKQLGTESAEYGHRPDGVDEK